MESDTELVFQTGAELAKGRFGWWSETAAKLLSQSKDRFWSLTPLLEVKTVTRPKGWTPLLWSWDLGTPQSLF